MKTNPADVVVIGSGPAGLEAARRVAAGGLNVTVISTTPPGGRATVGSLLPSKGWLHAVHHAASALNTDTGVAAAAARIRDLVSNRVAYSGEALASAGVTVVRGIARVVQADRVQLRRLGTDGTPGDPEELNTRAIVIASGSEPTFTPELRPDGRRIIAPRHTQHLSTRPASMIVAGGGITGVEYGSVFAGMGVPVELIASRELLPHADREHVDVLADSLSSHGLQFTIGRRVVAAAADEDGVTAELDDGSTRRASHLFLGTGRAGDLSVLEHATLQPDTHSSGAFLRVDAEGRSSVPGIWACGDVTGGPLTATRAVLQARRVAAALLADLVPTPGTGQATMTTKRRNALPPTEAAGAFMEVVYTEPQLAQLGPVRGFAGRTDLQVRRKDYSGSVMAGIERSAGDLKLWVAADGTIAGASAIGPAAAELLAPVQLAMQHGIPADALEAAPFAYPSYAEIVTL